SVRSFPASTPIRSVRQIAELVCADFGWRADSEVGEPKLPPLLCGHAAVDFILLDQRVEIDLDLRSVLIRVDFEVTKFASLAAERDVYVKTKRLLHSRRLIQRIDRVLDVFRLPLRERRIVRDEIMADF